MPPYFDHNATAPLTPAAEGALVAALRENWHNPSSPYRSGARASNVLRDCRARLSQLLGRPAAALVFNSGATEGNNAVFRHAARLSAPAGRAAVSPVEHPSVREAARECFPGRVDELPLGEDGRTDPAAVEAYLSASAADGQEVALVSIMAANNETGLVNDVAAIDEVCRRHRVPFHCDASQWLGKRPAAGLGATGFVSGCGHKFGAPKGIGFLALPAAAGAGGFTSLRGGDQESGHRAGTEDLPAIAAMAAAWEGREDELRDGSLARQQRDLRDGFERALAVAVPGCSVVGAGAERLWNTSLVILPRFANTRWVARLDRRGFEVSTGSACATAKAGPSHVLGAHGHPPEEAARAVRASGGWDTAAGDWEALATAFGDVWKELCAEARGGGDGVVVEVV